MSNKQSQPDAAPEADLLDQLTAKELLNIVSKAAQTVARTAASNDVREGFIAFNAALAEQFSLAKTPQA